MQSQGLRKRMWDLADSISEVINAWETPGMAEQFGYFKEPRGSKTS